MKNTIKELGDILRDKVTVKTGASLGLLFSGGLDSSILAYLRPDAIAFTVSLDSSGRDIELSRKISGSLNMEHHIVDVSVKEALEKIPEVIKILKSFDPALPNDLAAYFGLKRARDTGIKSVMTGDGSDELFGGYDYMRGINDLDAYIKRISKEMEFSSNTIGGYLGLEIVQPFIDKDVVELALSISRNMKIRKDETGTWGKWVLRKAFEDALPAEFIWQDKRPLEGGSGMTNIRRVLTEKVSRQEFDNAPRNMKFFNREHLYYYNTYKGVVGNVPAPLDGQKECTGCGTGIRPDAIHCRLCGYVYDWKHEDNQPSQ